MLISCVFVMLMLQSGLQSRATESVKAEVKNICEIEPSVTYEALVGTIAKQYFNSYHTEVCLLFHR